MTHSPPVPPANQSPFPIHEAPHEHHAGPAHAGEASAPGGLTVGIGVVIGIGAAALFGAWLLSRSGGGTPATRKAKAPARRPATVPKRTPRRSAGPLTTSRKRKSDDTDKG